MEKIRLTQMVQKSGCAAKVPALELREILNKVTFPKPHKELLVDGAYFDDAAIYKVTDEVALVQTLDFFTPIVDEPFRFGAIAAANALSDVYAMGGTPKTVMAILAYSTQIFHPDVIVEILKGASQKVDEAGANFVGGHSIDDESIKFGLSVTGFIHPQKIWSNQGAKVGNDLILTKPIGTGSLMSALKREEFAESDLEPVFQSMETLNNIQKFLTDYELSQIHAATDITGFGVLGHAQQMALASQVSFEIEFNKIPQFELLKTSLEKGILNKAHRTNREYACSNLKNADLPPMMMNTVCDPQTSGGLLLSVDSKSTEVILSKLKEKFPHSRKIGQVIAKKNWVIDVQAN